MADAPNQPNQVDPEFVAQLNEMSNAQHIDTLLELISQRAKNFDNLKSQLDSETDEQKRAEIQLKINNQRAALNFLMRFFKVLCDVCFVFPLRTSHLPCLSCELDWITMAAAPNQPNLVNGEVAAQLDGLTIQQQLDIVYMLATQMCDQHESLSIQARAERDEQKKADIQAEVDKTKEQMDNMVILIQNFCEAFPELANL